MSATTGVNWYKLNWPFRKTHPDCLRWRFQKKNLNFVVQKFKSFIFNFFFEYLPKYIFHQRFRFALLFLYKTTKVLKEGLKSKKLSLNQLRWQEFSNRLLVSNFDVIVYYMHVITSFYFVSAASGSWWTGTFFFVDISKLIYLKNTPDCITQSLIALFKAQNQFQINFC